MVKVFISNKALSMDAPSVFIARDISPPKIQKFMEECNSQNLVQIKNIIMFELNNRSIQRNYWLWLDRHFVVRYCLSQKEFDMIKRTQGEFLM